MVRYGVYGVVRYRERTNRAALGIASDSHFSPPSSRGVIRELRLRIGLSHSYFARANGFLASLLALIRTIIA